MSQPKLHIIVVHWKQPQQCLRTVQYLKAACGSCVATIEIVDNASDESDVAQLIGSLGETISLRRLRENKGWGGAINIALRDWLRAGRSDYLAVSAHDAIPAPGSIQTILEVISCDRTIGIASPQYERPSLSMFDPVRGPRAVFIAVGESADDRILTAPFAHGTLSVFSRECLMTVGGFDERFFAYGDEAEIGLRAGKAGFRSVVVGDARVVNPCTSVAAPLVVYLNSRNNLLLAELHGSRLLAMVRALLSLLNSARLRLSGTTSRVEFHARILSVWDYVTRNFGAPGRLSLFKAHHNDFLGKARREIHQ